MLTMKPTSSSKGIQHPDGSRPVNMPRLTYRNSSSGDSSSVTEHERPESSTQNTASIAATSLPAPMSEQSSGSPSSTNALGKKSSPSRPSPSKTTSGKQQAPIKKKTSIITSIFQTREPSTAAFVQMEEQLRKQQASNPNGRINPVGMPGVSAGKLPDTVPKVNSKWDGLPAGLKEKRQQEKRSHDRKGSSASGRPSSRETDFRYSHDRRSSSSTFSSFGSQSGSSDKYRMQFSDLYSPSDLESIGKDFVGRVRSGSPHTQSSQSLSAPGTPNIAVTSPSGVTDTQTPPKQSQRLRILTGYNRKASVSSSIPASSPTSSEASEAPFSLPRTPLDPATTSPLPIIDETTPSLVDPDLIEKDFQTKDDDPALVISSDKGMFDLSLAESKPGLEIRERDSTVPELPHDWPLNEQTLKALSEYADQKHTDTRPIKGQFEQSSESSRDRLGLGPNLSKSSDTAPLDWQTLDLRALKNTAAASNGKRLSGVSINKQHRSSMLGMFGKE